MVVLVALGSLLGVVALFGQLRGHQVWDVAPLACVRCLDRLCTRKGEGENHRSSPKLEGTTVAHPIQGLERETAP